MKKTVFGIFLAAVLAGAVLAQPPAPPALSPLSAAAGTPTLYTLRFTAQDTVPRDARFVLLFPEGFRLNMLSLAGSSVMKGGFSVQVNGQKAQIVRKGEGQPVAPGTAVDLKFSLVGNPAKPGPYAVSWWIERGDGSRLTPPDTLAVQIQ